MPAYDQLGSHRPEQNFQASPDWQQQFSGTQFSFDNSDFSDLFADLQGHRHRAGRDSSRTPIPGQDYVSVHITLAEAYRGTKVDLDLTMRNTMRIASRVECRMHSRCVSPRALRTGGSGEPHA